MLTTYCICSVALYLNSLRVLYNLSSFCAGNAHNSPSFEKGKVWAAVLWDLFLCASLCCFHTSVRSLANMFHTVFGASLPLSYELAVAASVQLLDMLIVNGSSSLWVHCPECVLWSFPHRAEGTLCCVRRVGWAVMLAQSLLTGHFEVFGIQTSAKTINELSKNKRIIRGKHPFVLSSFAVLWSARVMTLDRFLFAFVASLGMIYHSLLRTKVSNDNEEREVLAKVKESIESASH